MKIFPGLFVLAVIFLASCQSKTIYCTVPEIQFSLDGFSSGDAHAAWLYTYRKDAMFDSLVDSALLMPQFSTGGDTFISSRKFDYGYDYKLVLPTLGKSYYVTGITAGTHYTQTIQQGLVNNEVKYGCYNPIISYTVNSVSYSGGAISSSGICTIHIVK